MRASGNQPHFDIDFDRGRVGESLVEELPEAISQGKVEVKTDYRAIDTGNFYIETWQYGREDESDKRQSGINVTKADSWAFVIPQTKAIYLITTEDLKTLMRSNSYRETRQPRINSNTNASIGRLVPVEHVAQKMLGK